MKKIIFGIFAHPDDEAFGPSGTLLREIKNGTDVYLVSLTLGDAGTNPDNVADLAAVHEAEWRTAGKLLGVKEQIWLGYKDGQLNNLAMIEAAAKLEKLLREYATTYDEPATIELMTMDLNGISGHIDHIVAARAAALVFYRLKQTDTRFTRLRLACIPASILPSINTSWLFMESGRTAKEIDETIDNRDLQPAIIAIMRAHHSQRGDGETHIKNRADLLGIDYFRILT